MRLLMFFFLVKLDLIKIKSKAELKKLNKH